MKSAFKFLPRGFGSLLDYISPSAFDVIDWAAALKKSLSISRELVFESSVQKYCEEFKAFLPNGIEFDLSKNPNLQKEDTENKIDAQRFGEILLEIYFLQIYQSDVVFLDLRAERFKNISESRVIWRPNGLWYRFSNTFLDGIRGLYEGFYASNESKLHESLYQLGLYSNDMNPEAKSELLGLLENHFGQGKNSPVEFKVANFMKSFDCLFLFLKKEKLKLHEDFLFLGIYILTLYMHLESLNCTLNISEAYNIASQKK